MNILDNLLILLLIVLSFIAGLRLDNYYHQKANADRKEALERQFVRLRANADSDDPVKPYGTRCYAPQIPVNYNTGDFDGDPIGQQFMDHLKKNGHASTKLRKSDLAK